MNLEKITSEAIRAKKARGEKIAALTAYDFPMAKLLDEAGIPLLVIGDSVGMVVLGYPDTTHVTLADIEHHVAAVARAKPRSLLLADLPYQTYGTVPEALTHARQIAAAGADAVKLEGGRAFVPQIRAIIAAGIPVCGHLGMLPQSVREEGRYRIKGRTEDEHAALLADADALVEAGVFAIVLELVTPAVAREISKRIPVPTIGIGSGLDCDGQVLVTPDLLGTFPWFTPKHVKPKLKSAEAMREAVREWKASIENPQP